MGRAMAREAYAAGAPAGPYPRRQRVRPAPRRKIFLPVYESEFGCPRSALKPIIFAHETHDTQFACAWHKKSGALLRPALRCPRLVLAMPQVLAMASAATTSTVGPSAAVKASATATMETPTAMLTASAAPVHASFHSMSGAAVSETVPEIP